MSTYKDGDDYESPLKGFEDAPPLPTKFNEDGKSLYNPPGPRSSAYDRFPDPLMGGKPGGFDFHIYYMQHIPADARYARELHERIRREFPELLVFKLFDGPIGPDPLGPHPVAMFEVNVFSPHQTGALFSWLAVNRGPCSVLIHPNTDDMLRDHTESVTWMGPPYPVHVKMMLPPKDK